MRPAALTFLDEDFDGDELEPGDDLGLPHDYGHDELAPDDELGFRALYEDPGVLRRGRRVRA